MLLHSITPSQSAPSLYSACLRKEQFQRDLTVTQTEARAVGTVRRMGWHKSPLQDRVSQIKCGGDEGGLPGFQLGHRVENDAGRRAEKCAWPGRSRGCFGTCCVSRACEAFRWKCKASSQTYGSGN